MPAISESAPFNANFSARYANLSAKHIVPVWKRGIGDAGGTTSRRLEIIGPNDPCTARVCHAAGRNLQKFNFGGALPVPLSVTLAGPSAAERATDFSLIFLRNYFFHFFSHSPSKPTNHTRRRGARLHKNL
jgi:hypothetical protein